MSHAANAEGRHSSRIPGWLVILGGVPLLAAMAVEFVSIIGRHTGLMLTGSIELVQAAILVSSASAIVIATLSRAHAKIRVLLSRMSGTSGVALRGFNALGGAIFFLALAAGSAWIMLDMWDAREQSELLGLPYLPLRAFATVCLGVTGLLYAGRVITGVTRR